MVQGILNERLDEGIHHFQPFPEVFRRYQALERADSLSRILDSLYLTEGLRKLGIGVSKTAHAATQQEVGGGVQRKPVQCSMQAPFVSESRAGHDPLK